MLIMLAAVAMTMTPQLEAKGNIAYHAGACRYYLSSYDYTPVIKEQLKADTAFEEGFIAEAWKTGERDYDFSDKAHIAPKSYCKLYFGKLFKAWEARINK